VHRAEDPCLIIRESAKEVCKEKKNIDNHDVYEIEVETASCDVENQQKIPEQQSIVDIPPVLPKPEEPPPKSPPPVVFVLPKPPVFAVEPNPVPVPSRQDSSK
jgi:hypothetical protein